MRSRAVHNISQYFFNRFRKNEAQIHELTYLFWECTNRCNLGCLHCGSDCSFDSVTGDMPFEDFLTAIKPLREKYRSDSITVVFTGGEPLLRNDLTECGRLLRENGFRWGIVTNGYAYTEDIHSRLLSAGMGSVTLSLDGLAANHNWLRSNPNSFARAVKALDLIVSSDRLFYDVVTCVNKKNIDELPGLMEFLILHKVKAWRLFTIAPIGRASENSDLQLTSSQVKQLMDFICSAREDKRIATGFSCEAYVGPYEKRVRDSFFFCRAGINIASVLNDGSVSACPNIDRHFIQGNIYSDSFIDIWDNRFSVMRNRSWTKSGDCAHCKEYDNCNGGAMHMWNEKQDNIMVCLNKKIQQPFSVHSFLSHGREYGSH